MRNPYLNFTVDYFDQLRLQTMVINLRERCAPKTDPGLRKTGIAGEDDCFWDLCGLDLDFSESTAIYFVTDRYRRRYILVPIPEQELPLALRVGPYAAEALSREQVRELCDRMGLPPEQIPFLCQYYSTLPLVKDEHAMEAYINTLGRALFGTGNFTFRYWKEAAEPSPAFGSVPPPAYSEPTRKTIELRYAQETLFMDSVAAGDAEAAEQAAFSGVFAHLEDRSATSLQSRRDSLIVFNTLCRKAAERAGLHPVFLDAISRKNATRIETLPSAAEADGLSREILRNYCSAVREHNTKGYSEQIQSVVNHITFHLASDALTLQAIAAHFNLNKSYLSTRFKREVGVTLTDYVNQKRISRAAYLLSTQSGSIQSIACACGIPDITYFTRLFKRENGVTPTQYRKQLAGT